MKQASEASMSSMLTVLADFATGLYDIFYGFIERLLDLGFMYGSILPFRFSLHLPYHSYACKSNKIGNYYSCRADKSTSEAPRLLPYPFQAEHRGHV